MTLGPSQLPTAEQAAHFLSDEEPARRPRLIDPIELRAILRKGRGQHAEP